MLENSEIKKINALRERFMTGDYTTLAIMLGTTPDNVRKRLDRGKKDAIEAAEQLLDGRDKIIEDFKSSK